MSSPFIVRFEGCSVEVHGADRLSYLEDVTTQAFGDASVGTVRSALYLDVHGAPQAMFDAAVLAESVLLVAPDRAVAKALVEVLGSRTFLSDARFQHTDHVLIALRGEGAQAVADAANLATRPATVRPAGSASLIGREDGQLDLVCPPDMADDLMSLLTDAGAGAGSSDEFDEWRVASGVPGWETEVAPPHLPEEIGLLPTHVHLSKGCYPGQEAVARMWMLGRPRRRLALIGAREGAVDAGWTAGTGRSAVTVTSVAPRLSRALAFVPSDAQVGDTFHDDKGNRVEILQFVGADKAPAGYDPAVVQRRNRVGG